jgi:hypothetical protein
MGTKTKIAIGLMGLGVIGVLGVGILGILILGYLGFIPGLSDLMGANKAKDLGVKYSTVDYASGLAKVPGATVLNPEDLCVICEYTSSGSVPVNTSFSQEEFTAMMNARNSTKGPLKDAQFKFNADGTVEASGKITDPRVSGPVYLKAKIDQAAGKSAKLSVDYAELKNVPIPTDQLKLVEDIANKAIADTFAKNPGLNIKNIKIINGHLVFEGDLPKEVVGNPNVVPEEYQLN